MDTVKTAILRRHPQVSVSVQEKGTYRDFRIVEIRCGEGLKSAIAEALEAQASSRCRNPNSKRAIGILYQTHNTGEKHYHLSGI
jgi:hypothetical protein